MSDRRLPDVLSIDDMRRLHGSGWPGVARYMYPHRSPPARRIGPHLANDPRQRLTRATGRRRAPVRDSAEDLPATLSQSDMEAYGEQRL
jgi:hypothetical protein